MLALLRLFTILACSVAVWRPVAGQTPSPPRAVTKQPPERVDSFANARIRAEGLERSRVLETAIMLSDVHGPRLAGSAEFRKAAEWARRELATYGLSNPRLEPWGKRRGRSWTVERHSVEMIFPYYARIVAYPKAWSPPTLGVVRGTPVLVSINADSDLVSYRGRLRGAILLNGRASGPDSLLLRPMARRLSDAQLDSLRRLTDPGSPRSYWEDSDGWIDTVRRRQQLAALLREEGVAALLEPSRNLNAVEVSSYTAYDSDVSQTVPAFVVARPDYDRLVHLVERNRPVHLEVMLRSRYVADDSTGHNIVAELPGIDPKLKDEVVMVGGHFDSWTAGTGATDNAAGVAVAMEAIRILAASGIRPRRTVRIALWDGEEHEDYFGSMGYVRSHLGDPETMQLQPDHARISAYFNIDNGTGKIRGIRLQGNEALRPIFSSMLAPFADLGASAVTIGNAGSTDHMPFTAVGIPAFSFLHDPLDYDTHTHHTNFDVASSLSESDLKQAAVVVASVLFHTANRESMIPRLPLPAARRGAP